MKKKLVFLSAGCVLASAAIAVSCIVASRDGLFSKSRGAAADVYSVNIRPDDLMSPVTDAPESFTSGNITVKTGLNNDVNISFAGAYTYDMSGNHFIKIHDDDFAIYNTSSINFMNSITLATDHDIDLLWGFEKDGLGNPIYVRQMINAYPGSSGTTYTFDDEQPNYFLIRANHEGHNGGLYPSGISIKMGADCATGPNANPYKDSGKIRYKLFHDEEEKPYYKAVGFINDDDPENPKNLTFASEFDGIKVTSVDGFGGNTSIESIDLTGSNVTELFTFAFSGCTNLTTITGFDQITSFRYECLKNTKITGALTFSNQLVRIEGSAFYNCDEITNVVFADGCDPTLLDSSAFNNCDSIVNCTIGNAMTNSVPAFYNCDLFANYITATDSVYFKAVDGILYSVEPDDNLKLLSIPAQNACENYVMPANVDNTKEGFAKKNAKLKTFVYNDTITVVNNESFEYCTTLTSVTIGASVSIIYNDAFDGCTSLSTINFKGTSAQWNSFSFGSGWHNGVPATVVHCLGDSVDVPLS